MEFATVEDDNGLACAVPDGFGGTRLVYFARKHGADLSQTEHDLAEGDDISVDGFDGRAEAPSGAPPVHGVGGCALCRIFGGAQ